MERIAGFVNILLNEHTKFIHLDFAMLSNCLSYLQVKIIYGVTSRRLRLYKSSDKKQELSESSVNDVFSLHSSTLFADFDG